MRQVICIHGGEVHASYEAYIAMLNSFTIDPYLEKKRWRTTLQESLGTEYRVVLPQMPNKYNAQYEEWEIWFDKYLPFLEDECVLIGHSLGGIFLLRYLASHALPVTVGALYLVATPYFTSDTPNTGGFFITDSMLETVQDQHHTIVLVHSKDDPVVPFDDVQRYIEVLPLSRSLLFSDKGHFLQEEFPELVSDIKHLPAS